MAGKRIEIGDKLTTLTREPVYTVKARFEDFPPGFECMRPLLVLESELGRRVYTNYAVVFGRSDDEYAMIAGEKFGVYPIDCV